MKRLLLKFAMLVLMLQVVWAEEARRLLLPLPHNSQVQSMAFNRSRDRLATGDKNGLIKIWNWKTRTVEVSLKPNRGDEVAVKWVAWTGDTTVLVMREDNQLRSYDIESASEIKRLDLPGRAPALVGSRYLAVGGEQGEWTEKTQVPVIHLHSLEDGKLVRTLTIPDVPGNSFSLRALAGSPDGTRLTYAIDPNRFTELKQRIGELDVESGQLIRVQEIPGYAPDHLRYSPSGKSVAGWGWDLMLWGEGGVKSIKTDRSGLVGVDWASESDLVYVISNGGATLHRLKADGEAVGAGKAVERGAFTAPILVSPEGIPAFTTYEGDIFNGETGENLFKAPAISRAESLVYHPSGRLIVGMEKGNVLVWDMTTGKYERKFEVPGAIRGVAVTQDGSRLAITTNHDNDVRIYDWKSGKLVKKLATECCQGAGWVLRFSPDGSKLAVLQSKPPGWRDELLLFDVRSGELAWKKENSFKFAFHPRANQWAVVRKDGLAEINLDNGEEVFHKIPYLKACAYDAEGRLHAIRCSRSGGETLLLQMYPKSTGRLDEGKQIGYSGMSMDQLVWSDRDRSWWMHCDSGALMHMDGSGKEVERLPDRVGGMSTSTWQILPGNLLAVWGREGTIEFWRGGQTTPEGELVVLDQGKNWLVTSANGFFDGTDEAERLIEWQVGKQRFRVDQFFQQGYRPGLLREFYRGAKISKAAGPLSRMAQPPKLEILSPTPGTRFEDREVEVKVRLLDQGNGFSRPKLFVNGHAVAASQTRSEAKDVYIFKTRLQPGVNDLRATGFDHEGLVESRGDRLRITCTAPARRQPVLHVLAVGVNKASAGRALQFAESDARAISSQLKSGLFAQAQVKLLLGSQAEKSSVDEAFRQIEAQAEPQDTVVVFFAGHGVAEQSGYRFLLAGKDVETGSLTSNELATYLETIQAHRQFVILDTCHSAAASPDLVQRFAVSQQRMARGSGTFLLAACRSGETAAEIPSLKHGLLTYSLLSALGKGAPVNAQGQVTVNSLIQSVSSDFPEVTRRYAQEQELFQFGNGSDFPLLQRKS